MIGESGSGKSTISKLILGLYPVEKGTVMFQEQPVFSYMPQSSQLFTGSIAQNIAISMSPDMNRVRKCAELVGAADFIAGKPQAYDYRVSDIERIALARALYRNANIMILDEPSASLDEETEKQIKETISNIQDRTVLMISHRMSLVDGCSQIIEIDNGRVTRVQSAD